MSAVASVLSFLLAGSAQLGLASHPVIAEVASIDDPHAPDDDVQSADAPLADVELPDAYREPDPCESEPGLPAVLFLDNHRPPNHIDNAIIQLLVRHLTCLHLRLLSFGMMYMYICQ